MFFCQNSPWISRARGLLHKLYYQTHFMWGSNLAVAQIRWFGLPASGGDFKTLGSFLQLYLMRDLERMCGPLRMTILYLGSGIIGNLASAIFVPFRAESGPAGSQFGLLAALIIEVVNVWPMLTRFCYFDSLLYLFLPSVHFKAAIIHLVVKIVVESISLYSVKIAESSTAIKTSLTLACNC